MAWFVECPWLAKALMDYSIRRAATVPIPTRSASEEQQQHPSLALVEVARLYFAPKVPEQISPGQSAATPWVRGTRGREALKGRNN